MSYGKIFRSRDFVGLAGLTSAQIAAGDQDLENIIDANLGIKYEYVLGQRAITAKLRPDEYFAQREGLKKELAKKRNAEFAETYNILMKTGYPDDVAKGLAMKRVKNSWEDAKQLVEVAYPTKLFDRGMSSAGAVPSADPDKAKVNDFEIALGRPAPNAQANAQANVGANNVQGV